MQFSISKLCNSLFEATFSVVVRTNVHRIVHTSLVPSWKIVIYKSPADSMEIKKKIGIKIQNPQIRNFLSDFGEC